MRIARLVLRNVGRFRGEHALDLGAMVYGVNARDERDPECSNWRGKTTLVDAPALALYNWHRWALDDEWISAGEAEGSVELTTDDGTTVTRSRRRGRSTQLVVGGTTRPASGAEAQRLVEVLVGLSREDYFATCHFRQKEMARFVTSTPGDRQAIVAGWLGLDRLVAAHEVARRRLDRAAGSAALLREAVARCRRELAALDRGGAQEGPAPPGQADAPPVDVGAVLGALAARELAAAGVAGEAKTAQDLSRAAWRAAVEAEAARRDVAELAQAESELAAHGRPDPGPTREEVDGLEREALAAKAESKVRGDEAARRRVLARGEFDGRCPVGDIECPAKDRLNADRAASARLRDAAGETHAAARDDERRAVILYDAARTELGRVQAHERRRAELEDRVARARERVGTSPEMETRVSVSDLAAAMGEAERAYAVARAALGAVGRDRLAGESLAAELARAEADMAAADPRLGVWRAASAVLGRGGAQRRAAEEALAEVEAAANAMLAGAGVGLQLSVRWAREAASGLAADCDACGAPYPRTGGARACSACGEPRGPKVIERLDLVPTARSGAADDLAGVAFQLAAAAWLRRRRGAAWASYVLDEPFAAFDAKNRRALATHIAAMLRTGGAEQAFVVAHQDDALESLPRRIEVVADGPWSSCRVVA